jgi:hypothetical protein
MEDYNKGDSRKRRPVQALNYLIPDGKKNEI